MNLSERPLTRIAVALTVIASIWSITSRITTRFDHLPVRQVARVTAPPPPPDTQAIYPVWVAGAGRASSTEGGVESAFGVPDEVAAIPTVAQPDYADIVKQAAVLDGVAPGLGAFVNGAFYPVGAPITGLAVTRAQGGQLVPVLKSVADNRAVIDIEGQTIMLRSRGGRHGSL